MKNSTFNSRRALGRFGCSGSAVPRNGLQLTVTCWSASCSHLYIKDWPVTRRKCLYSAEIQEEIIFFKNYQVNGVSKTDRKRDCGKIKMAGRTRAASHRLIRGESEFCSSARCITRSQRLNNLPQKIEDAFLSASDLRKRQ